MVRNASCVRSPWFVVTHLSADADSSAFRPLGLVRAALPGVPVNFREASGTVFERKIHVFITDAGYLNPADIG